MRIRKLIKFNDFLTGIIAMSLGLFSFLENEEFRREITVNGVIVKEMFISSNKDTVMRIVIIALTIVLGKYLIQLF